MLIAKSLSYIYTSHDIPDLVCRKHPKQMNPIMILNSDATESDHVLSKLQMCLQFVVHIAHVVSRLHLIVHNVTYHCYDEITELCSWTVIGIPTGKSYFELEFLLWQVSSIATSRVYHNLVISFENDKIWQKMPLVPKLALIINNYHRLTGGRIT